MALKSSRSRPCLLAVITLVVTIIPLSLIVLYSTLYKTLIRPLCADRSPSHDRTVCVNDKSWEQENGHHYSTILFELHPILENLSSSANEAWAENILTPKGGFLWVQLNQTLYRAWGISMFHASHCLQTLRTTIQRGEANDPGHIGHCIGYIAQVSLPFRATRPRSPLTFVELVCDLCCGRKYRATMGEVR